MSRFLATGECVPWGYPFFRYLNGVERFQSAWYGLCWSNMWGDSMTICPLPFNIVAYYARLGYMWLRYDFAYRPRWMSRTLVTARRAYRRGVGHGRNTAAL